MRKIEIDGVYEYIGVANCKDCASESADEMKDFIYIVREKMGPDSAQFLKDYVSDWENPPADDYELACDAYHSCLNDVLNELDCLISQLGDKTSISGRPYSRLFRDIQGIRNRIYSEL